jgi:hypothetical protein
VYSGSGERGTTPAPRFLAFTAVLQVGLIIAAFVVALLAIQRPGLGLEYFAVGLVGLIVMVQVARQSALREWELHKQRVRLGNLTVRPPEYRPLEQKGPVPVTTFPRIISPAKPGSGYRTTRPQAPGPSTCPRCGTALRMGATFCHRCGMRLR